MTDSIDVKVDGRRRIIHALIVVGGFLTVLSAFAFPPLGVVLTLAAGVLAVYSRGTERRLFIWITVFGALACIAMSGLIATGEMTSETTVVEISP
jgi:hypothetical protein